MVVPRTGESTSTFLIPQESSREESAVASSLDLAATSVSTKTPRPNPQSQSLSRGYGSILPTSLIYIILSTRGCTPWRPEAVMSTTSYAFKSRQWVFKGRRRRTGHCKKSNAFPASKPYRRSIRFHGLLKLLRIKENYSRSPRQRPHSRLCYHSITTCWYRNINLFPFR